MYDTDYEDKRRWGEGDEYDTSGEALWLHTDYGWVSFDTKEEMDAYRLGLMKAEEDGTVDEFLETA